MDLDQVLIIQNELNYITISNELISNEFKLLRLVMNELVMNLNYIIID